MQKYIPKYRACFLAADLVSIFVCELVEITQCLRLAY